MADKQAAHRLFIPKSGIFNPSNLSDNFDFIKKRRLCQLSDNFNVWSFG